ncbi:hypothetical protein [Streptomyces sp. 135]|uniref:hypothetical protein n=1 Tax=Streptomyces sp. 135 TaxID=2838850 RepID=UPI001CC0AFB8|nr:hypothetical protein [Streptomyces sp. 135]
MFTRDDGHHVHRAGGDRAEDRFARPAGGKERVGRQLVCGAVLARRAGPLPTVVGGRAALESSGRLPDALRRKLPGVLASRAGGGGRGGSA